MAGSHHFNHRWKTSIDVVAVDEPDSQAATINSHRGAPTIPDGVSIGFYVNGGFDSYGATFAGQAIKTIATAAGDLIECQLEDAGTTTYWGSIGSDTADSA